MKLIVFIINFIFFSLFCSSSFANEEDVIYDSLDFEIRYFNAISKSAVILQEYFNKYPESEHEKIIKTDQFINNVLRKELYEIADIYAEQYQLDPTRKEILVNFIKKFDPRRLVDLALDIKTNKKFYARKFGFGLGLALLCGLALEVAVPILLVKSGLSLLIPASMAVPFSVILATMTIPYDRFIRWKKGRNALGINYPEYLLMRRQIQNHLKSVSHLDLLIPVKVNGITSEKLLTIQKSNVIDKVFDLFNLKRPHSNYVTILRFIKNHAMEDEYTKWITRQKNLSNEEKTVFLVHHLFESGDEKVQASFITEFYPFFTSRPKLPRTHKLKSWTKLLLSSRSGEDIAKAMSLIPPGTPPVVIIQIWEEIAAPQLIKNIPMKIGALRKLNRELEVLKAIASTKQHKETWNKSFAKLFNQKISPIINNYGSYCHKSQQDLFHFLLNNPL